MVKAISPQMANAAEKDGEYIPLYRGEVANKSLRQEYAQDVGEGMNNDEGKWYSNNVELALTFAEINDGGQLYLLKVPVDQIDTPAVEENTFHRYDNARVFLVHDPELRAQRVDITRTAKDITAEGHYDVAAAFSSELKLV